MNYDFVAVVDFGAKNNQIVAKRIRELNVFCEVFSSENIKEKLAGRNVDGFVVIGDAAVTEIMPDLGKLVLNLSEVTDIIEENSPTDILLKDFLFETCGCKGNWLMSAYAENAVKAIKDRVGDKKVLCALSGGVDSSVCAVLVNKAIGKNLTCIFVDHGLMRLNEGDEVERIFKKQYKIDLIRINAEDRFLAKLAGISDPETKRKIIGEEFIRVFEEEGKKIGAVDFLCQGTIYPDIIESGTENAAVVKSHHNVGGLPDVIDFKEIIEPLKDLFKDEVRKLGLELGIPAHLVFRQPFPGPGLGIRIIGDITKQKLDTLRQTDFIFREEIAKAGLDKEIWQYFTILTNLRSVGVANDARTYGYTIALRAVYSSTAMTAEFAKIPYDVLEKVSVRLVNEVENVTRVVYDITSKPPSTIEWE